MKAKFVTVLFALIAATAISASAAVVDLTFENINITYPDTNYAQILNYYNGGTSSDGTSGTNYGVSFPSNALAICLNTVGNVCSDTSRGGLGDPSSQKGGLFFLTGSNTFVDVAAGFTTGFSFNYTAYSTPGSVQVYSGLDGTGTLLANLALPATGGACNLSVYNAYFCPFYPIGVAFSGTAMSIDFGGTANQIVFDDVTFGSATPGTPEPGTLVMFGSGVIGLAGLLRRKFNV
jgi:hypothetical protein